MSESKVVHLKVVAKSHTGLVREHNEDNFAYCLDENNHHWIKQDTSMNATLDYGIFIIADGMGGSAQGEVASDIAVTSIQNSFDQYHQNQLLHSDRLNQLLSDAILEAHFQIKKHALQHKESRGMGTTIVVGVFSGNKATIGWVGDSRLYRSYRQSYSVQSNPEPILQLITADHSVVWEMVKNNELTREEARLHPHSNMITQSLGDASNVPYPEVINIDLYKDDRFLFCTDGINSPLSDDSIKHILSSNEMIDDAAKDLIEDTLNAGAPDNLTFIIIDKLSGLDRPLLDTKNIETTDVLPDTNSSKTQRNVITIAPKSPYRFLPFIIFIVMSCGLFLFYRIKNKTHDNASRYALILSMIGQVESSSLKDSILTELHTLDSTYQSSANYTTYDKSLNRLEEKLNLLLSAGMGSLVSKHSVDYAQDSSRSSAIPSEQDDKTISTAPLAKDLDHIQKEYTNLLKHQDEEVKPLNDVIHQIDQMLSQVEVVNNDDYILIKKRINIISTELEKIRKMRKTPTPFPLETKSGQLKLENETILHDANNISPDNIDKKKNKE